MAKSGKLEEIAVMKRKNIAPYRGRVVRKNEISRIKWKIFDYYK